MGAASRGKEELRTNNHSIQLFLANILQKKYIYILNTQYIINQMMKNILWNIYKNKSIIC